MRGGSRVRQAGAGLNLGHGGCGQHDFSLGFGVGGRARRQGHRAQGRAQRRDADGCCDRRVGAGDRAGQAEGTGGGQPVGQRNEAGAARRALRRDDSGTAPARW